MQAITRDNDMLPTKRRAIAEGKTSLWRKHTAGIYFAVYFVLPSPHRGGGGGVCVWAFVRETSGVSRHATGILVFILLHFTSGFPGEGRGGNPYYGFACSG